MDRHSPKSQSLTEQLLSINRFDDLTSLCNSQQHNTKTKASETRLRGWRKRRSSITYQLTTEHRPQILPTASPRVLQRRRHRNLPSPSATTPAGHTAVHWRFLHVRLWRSGPDDRPPLNSRSRSPVRIAAGPAWGRVQHALVFRSSRSGPVGTGGVRSGRL